MKYIYILLFLFLIINKSVQAQEKESIPIKNNSPDINVKISKQGNLELLARKVYQAFLIYTTGDSVLYMPGNLPVGISSKEERERIISEFKTPPYSSLPVMIDATHEDEGKNILIDSAKMHVSLDKIKSIEVIYDPFGEAVIYGTHGMTCIIKIKFKEN